MKKYYKVFISKKDEYTEIKKEIARFTSKGLMHICLRTIEKTYEKTEYEITYTRD